MREFRSHCLGAYMKGEEVMGACVVAVVTYHGDEANPTLIDWTMYAGGGDMRMGKEETVLEIAQAGDKVTRRIALAIAEVVWPDLPAERYRL